MFRQFQLLAAVFLAILFSIDCNAQSNDSDRALLKKINGTAYRRTPFGIDARLRVDSLWFLRVNGEFSSMLKFRRLASMQLLEMKSGWLGRIAKSYPSLYHLDFDASLLKADELDALAEFKNLRRLVITSDNSDGAACLKKIAQLTGLQSLTIPLRWQQNLNDLRGLTNLKSLSIGNRNWTTNSGEPEIELDYRNFHLLYRFLIGEQKRSPAEASQVIGLMKNGRFELPALNDDLVPYFNELKNTEEMTLGIGELSKEGLGLLKLPAGLTKLHLTDNRSLELLEKISKLNSIHHLKLEGDNEAIVGQIRRIEGLKKLELVRYQVGTEGLSLAEGFEKVEHLDFKSCHISEDGLSSVGNLRRLKHLDLSSNQLTDLDGLSFENLRELEHLNLSDNPLVKFDLSQISELNQLVHLDLGNSSVSDVDLTHLSSLRNLKYVNLRDWQTTPEGRFRLYRDLDWSVEKSLESEGVRLLKEGTRITIGSRVEISQGLLQAISQLDSLTELYVFHNAAAVKVVGVRPIQKLNLSRCEELSNESIKLLSVNQSIKSLSISGSDLITDEGFQFLERMTWLESLRFRGDGVSEAAKEALKAKLPNCKIN